MKVVEFNLPLPDRMDAAALLFSLDQYPCLCISLEYDPPCCFIDNILALATHQEKCLPIMTFSQIFLPEEVIDDEDC